MRVTLTILIAYLLGNFSPAYVLGKSLGKKDIREYGSGNAGSTNALRVFGKKIGILTFLLDITKGVVAVSLGSYIMGLEGSYIGALFVVLGHNWPAFLKFKGGKGVATSIGALLTLNWKLGLIILVIGVTVVIFTKYVSLGSLLGSVSAPFVSFLLVGTTKSYLFYTTLLLGLLSIFKHRSNIKRLIKGKESKITSKL